MQLKEKGLIFTDEQKAALFFEDVNYFRFAAYLRPFQLSADNKNLQRRIFIRTCGELTRVRHKAPHPPFRSNPTHRNLAAFSHDKQDFSCKGPFWFIDPTLANNKHIYADNLSTLGRELKRSKDEIIKEHISKYGILDFPPSWKFLELSSF